jgi:hypothetical protein
MATTLKATTAGHLITIGGVSYTGITDTCNVRSTAPIENETTFANEATGGEYSTGTEVVRIDLGGPTRFDGPGTKPFIPISAYQDKVFSITYVSGCTITGTCSEFDGGPTDTRAGNTRRWTASFQVTGTFVVTWDETGPT